MNHGEHEPRDYKLQTQVTKSFARRARVVAAQKDLTLPDVVRAAITEYLAKHEIKPPQK